MSFLKKTTPWQKWWLQCAMSSATSRSLPLLRDSSTKLLARALAIFSVCFFWRIKKLAWHKIDQHPCARPCESHCWEGEAISLGFDATLSRNGAAQANDSRGKESFIEGCAIWSYRRIQQIHWQSSCSFKKIQTMVYTPHWLIKWFFVGKNVFEYLHLFGGTLQQPWWGMACWWLCAPFTLQPSSQPSWTVGGLENLLQRIKATGCRRGFNQTSWAFPAKQVVLNQLLFLGMLSFPFGSPQHGEHGWRLFCSWYRASGWRWRPLEGDPGQIFLKFPPSLQNIKSN